MVILIHVSCNVELSSCNPISSDQVFLLRLWFRSAFRILRDYKKLFNLWCNLRDVFRKHRECALQPRTLWRFVKFVAILWCIPVFRHGCALKPKTLQRFVQFVAILRRIPIFRQKHCDDLLNFSRFYDIFWFFITDVHWWILKPRTLRRFVKFVAIWPTKPWHLSRFVVINKLKE
jgi:hypothetical protein